MLVIMKAVILAGGFGKRLKPLTEQMPKPMIKVLNVPIIEWQVRWLRTAGVEDFVLCVGYMKEKILDHMGDGRKFRSNIEYSVEDKPLETGGALKNAKDFLADEDSFLMLNGDVLTELDPKKLYCAN